MPRNYLIFYLFALGFLWWRLINHLRVEWSVNSQYSYGYAVSFLCLFLLWRRMGQGAPPETDVQGSGFRIQADQRTEHRGQRGQGEVALSRSMLFAPLLVAALAYAPTRLIQEANPEWRLVSWALALEVMVITLCLLPSISRGASRMTFAACFFLVAVPWPTLVEGPLIRAMTNASTATTVEALSFLGVPVLQHGNVIEVGSGVVGIDDACSGIRSFQATLMIALFLGEVYRLTTKRRVLCILAGFALSFLFNVSRTTLLTFVAARKGTAAISAWHDPAGVTILVACFVCLWLLTLWFRSRSPKAKVQRPKCEANHSRSEPTCPTAPSLHSFICRLVVPLGLVVWLLAVEAGTELWYRSHEWHLPKTAVWRVELPHESGNLMEIPFSEKTKQFLRYDEGLNAAWDVTGKHWQAIFLRWDPGRIAVHLAKSHTPASCLTATGRQLLAESTPHVMAIKGLQLPFRSYVATDETEQGPLHVFYCLWEDRAETQFFGAMSQTYANRLAPVLAGRRNCGQRSLEIAVRGFPGLSQAEEALREQLESLLKVGP